MASLQAAIKRSLDASLASVNNTTSTPAKQNGNAAKRNRMDLNLDESIIDAVGDFVNESIDGALNQVNESDQISQKNKKIAQSVLKELKPTLKEAIEKTLNQFYTELLQQLDDKITLIANAVQKQGLLAHFQNDKLEQYTRRENFRVSGLDISDNDNKEVLMEKVCVLIQSIGVDLNKDDFVACHRAGKSRKQVICRLKSRDKKEEIMRNKKKLKGRTTESGDKIYMYVNEDLTPLRLKMLKLAKQHFKGAHTINGKVVVYKDDKPHFLESPDDFFEVGIDIDCETLKKLGLSDYIVGTKNDGK